MIKLKVESLKLKGLCLAAILFFNLNAFAQTTFDAGNTAYAEGRYDEAASLYQAMIDEQPDLTLPPPYISWMEKHIPGFVSDS